LLPAQERVRVRGGAGLRDSGSGAVVEEVAEDEAVALDDVASAASSRTDENRPGGHERVLELTVLAAWADAVGQIQAVFGSGEDASLARFGHILGAVLSCLLSFSAIESTVGGGMGCPTRRRNLQNSYRSPAATSAVLLPHRKSPVAEAFPVAGL
jgi:hypothetical protein